MTFASGERKKNFLVTMNIPAMMARRDAAYDVSKYLIRDHLFSYPEEGRSEIYEYVLKLLDVAIENTAMMTGSKGESSFDESSHAVLQYLRILKDTVKAAATLVKHELIMFEDESKLAEFMGSDISNQFRSTDEIFSNSEMNIYHCISELVDIAEPTMNKYREYWKKSFQKTDLNRYRKAFAEFESLYGEYKKKLTLTPGEEL